MNCCTPLRSEVYRRSSGKIVLTLVLRYSGDATNAFASSSKHGGATSEAQHAEAGRKSTRKRARDANADEEGASKRKKPNDAAHTQSNKPQTARPAKANRSTRATRRVLREPSEGWIAQSAGAKKEKGKARAVSTPSTQIPDDDNSHRALDLLDTSYTQIRNYLLDMIQNGSPASAARIISLEAQLAAAQAQNAALEAQLNEAHQGNAELTGGSSSPPQILEVQAPSTSSEASENDTTRASLAAAAVQSDLASVDDADSTMSDAFRSDPLATPARPLRDHQDEFGMYFEGDTPDPTILDPTQIQHSPPAAHIDSGEATARAEEFPEDDVDYGNTTTLP